MFAKKIEFTHEELAVLMYNLGMMGRKEMMRVCGSIHAHDDVYTNLFNKVRKAYEGYKPPDREAIADAAWDAVNAVCKGR